MPFYEYQCKSCGHTLEAMQKINDSPLKKCPDCGKSQLTRLMSAPVFRLKGGGWYETDFKGDSDNKKNLADRPESDSGKDDGKPAADSKAETAPKDAAAKDATSKDAGTKDSGSKDAGSKDAAKPAADKSDKPAAKAAPEPAKKPSGGGISKRGVAAVGAKTSPKKAPPKKAAAKSKKRR